MGSLRIRGNGHIVEQQTALGEGHETIVTDTETLAEYTAVTGFNPDAGPPGSNPTDQGALIQDGLADLRKNGLAGQKIAAFARVTQADRAEVMTALAELGAVSLGVNLPQSAMDQFHAGQPWTVSGDATILGGHCITAFGYDATVRLRRLLGPGRPRYVGLAGRLLRGSMGGRVGRMGGGKRQGPGRRGPGVPRGGVRGADRGGEPVPGAAARASRTRAP